VGLTDESVLGYPDRHKEATMAAQPVVHFEIHGKDGKQLQDFYSRAFDWEIDANNPMQYGIVNPGPGGIGGGVTASEASGVVIYIQVSDPAAALKKVNEMGGTTVMEPADVPGGPTIAQFRDPAGNLMGLVKG
jgi:predicted enzyme related to lactoylglutathione lyase